MDNDEQEFTDCLRKYEDDKQYDRDSVDIVPLIACNALNMYINILVYIQCFNDA